MSGYKTYSIILISYLSLYMTVTLKYFVCKTGSSKLICTSCKSRHGKLLAHFISSCHTMICKVFSTHHCTISSRESRHTRLSRWTCQACGTLATWRTWRTLEQRRKHCNLGEENSLDTLPLLTLWVITF